MTFSGGGGQGSVVTVGNALTARAFATDYATPPGQLGPVFVVVPVSMPANGVVQSLDTSIRRRRAAARRTLRGTCSTPTC